MNPAPPVTTTFVGGCLRNGELPVPELEREERPKPVAVINTAQMLVDHRPDCLRTQVTTLERRGRENQVVQKRTKLTTEPPPNRNAESLLAPREVLGR